MTTTNCGNRKFNDGNKKNEDNKPIEGILTPHVDSHAQE
jgi:hypothetical protein